MVIQVLVVTLALLEFREPKDPLGLLVNRVHKDQEDLREPLDRLGHQDRQDQQVL